MGHLDDIIIFSKTEEEHLQHLEEIFVRLHKFGLKMKREKCSFFKKHIQYLGHLVSEKGFEPLPEKLESIRKMPAPRTAKEVKQFLGLIGYYQKFVPRFADISRPLTKLTRHNVTFEWTDQCGKAFNHLHELLMEYPKAMDPEVHKRTSEYREHSRNLWSSEKVTDEKTSRKTVHQMFERDAHLGNSENGEHSQNSREKQAGADIGNVKVTVSTEDNQSSTGVSHFLEHSQNSLSSDEPKVNTGEVNVSLGIRDGQCLAMTSEFRELSSNSQVETGCSQGTHHKQNAKVVCMTEPSEYSRDLLRGVGNVVSVPKYSWFKSMSQIVGLTAAWQQSKVEGDPVGANTACNAKTNSNPVHTGFNFFL